MTKQEKKDAKYWETFNYYLMIYGCEYNAHLVTKNELGYEPMYSE